MLFINKLFNSIACLLSFTNLQLVIPGRTWILLYVGRTVYKRLWLYIKVPPEYRQYLSHLLPPANEVCKGYVITGCLSIHRGVCLPHCMLGYIPPCRHPPGQTHPPPAQCMLGIRSTSVRYASHCNVFVFYKEINGPNVADGKNK